MRVLIVDDDEMVRIVVQAALEEAGYETATAGDGAQAMEIIRRGKCRIVISDWQMPGMNGLDLCRAVRSEELSGYVYVILLTASGELQNRIDGLSAGADDFIGKPFNSAELVARVRPAERVVSLETRDVAMFAMAKLAESRDPETGAHLERVQSYCRVLARQMARQEKFQIDAEYIRLIYLTSPLHDIGKVGIPDCVLLKPGRLSDREFEIMKSHARMGAQTLQAALEKFPGVKFLEMARDIAASHHERFDGSGYPAKLAGEQIPLCGRIVALADVYDALTSKRVYKAAFSHEVAKATIVNEKGIHFDPDVVDAFLQAEAEFLEIRERFSEMQTAVAA